MPPLNSLSLVSIVQNVVPESRSDQKLRETLIVRCKDILNSHIGQNREIDPSHLTELLKRHLLQITQSNTSSLRLTNLISRLSDQPVLTRKNAVLTFLHSVASSRLHIAPSPAFLPTIAPSKTNRRALSPAIPNNDISNASRRNPGKSKAEILREYRAKASRSHLRESLLLRDALYILQGISGKYVRFGEENGSQDEKLIFKDDNHHIISAPNKTIIHRLAELGHLYNRISKFVRDREDKAGNGLIEQAVCHYLDSQLTEYYRLIAVLESQMRETFTRDSAEGTEEIGNDMVLSLKRLDVWIDDWRLRLRMMSVCVEGCKDHHGGALVNLIHSYTEHVDPFIRKVTDELLEEVSRPFFSMLHKWLFSGELYDPFSEFFVALDPELAHFQYVQAPEDGMFLASDAFQTDVDADDAGAYKEESLKLWEEKYIFRKDMLPAFIGESFGKKIFSTGKSLNFIRYSCHDSEWVATREKLGSASGTLQCSNIAGLERSIDSAYRIASQRLFDVFLQKFKLLDHLAALKHYLLLGYGDFAEHLMESLGPSLSRPANLLFRHNLTATLEAAIRSTTAQHDPPDVLRRLDARMLEYSHGEIGWDVFTLEYKVDAPLDTVMDTDTMIGYLRAFQHLWKMKRIEGSLTTGWMRIAGGSRTFLRIPVLETEWHHIRLCLSEMIHFIRQLQAYCHLEVIECQWKVLQEFIDKKEGDLDALIAAHRQFVDKVTKKTLLHYPKSGKEDYILRQVQEMFDLILQFRAATDDLYNFTLAEASRLDSVKDQRRGVHSGTRSRTNSSATKDALPHILQRTRDYGSTFSERAQSLVHSLQAHPDLDCRFLGIRLTFSDYYKSKRERASEKLSV